MRKILVKYSSNSTAEVAIFRGEIQIIRPRSEVEFGVSLLKFPRRVSASSDTKRLNSYELCRIGGGLGSSVCVILQFSRIRWCFRLMERATSVDFLNASDYPKQKTSENDET
ncbi:PPM-type phosphatase domain-containing protein [Psidium guajava]|nr:PPM-type phosphatase domain-containing protein [Psidium guajava]